MVLCRERKSLSPVLLASANNTPGELATMTEVVRYVQSTGGIKIAYSVRGSGLPLIYFSAYPRSNLELELKNPKRRQLFDRLARSHRLVRFDYRGMGMSDRNYGVLSLDAMVADVEAIAEQLGVSECVLLAVGSSASIASAVAASGKVDASQLILWDPIAPDSVASPAVTALTSIMDEHWELFLRTRFRIGLSDEEAQEAAEIVLSSTTPIFFREARQVWSQIKPQEVFSKVTCPTLILHPAGRSDSREMSALIGSTIPGAVVAAVEGESSEIFNSDLATALHTVDEFLGVSDGAQIPDDSFDATSCQPALTHRELDIVRLLIAGLRSKEIGNRLGLSPHTVERHIANLYRKTGANGRVALTVFALRHGLSTETKNPLP